MYRYFENLLDPLAPFDEASAQDGLGLPENPVRAVSQMDGRAGDFRHRGRFGRNRPDLLFRYSGRIIDLLSANTPRTLISNRGTELARGGVYAGLWARQSGGFFGEDGEAGKEPSLALDVPADSA
ncbi:MAG: hypothetical protein R3256_14365 [Thalassovita sp.]|nr:hypothetical protein [Thalassovita sp.]